MFDIFVRVQRVDMDGYNGRDHHHTKEMEDRFVRVTNMETIPADEEDPDDVPYQVFYGILVDANGDDVEGGEVELIDHEIEGYQNNTPRIYGKESRG